MLCLWHVILDHEHGLVGCTRVAAKEPGVVCTRIVVFIQLEAQAEPGGAGQVDGGECTAPKDDRVPAGTGGRTEYSNIALICSGLEVGWLQSLLHLCGRGIIRQVASQLCQYQRDRDKP